MHHLNFCKTIRQTRDKMGETALFQTHISCEICVDLCGKEVMLCWSWATTGTAQLKFLSLLQSLCQPLLQGRRALFVLRNSWYCTNKVSIELHTAKIQQEVLWPNLFLYLSALIAITVHSYIFGLKFYCFCWSKWYIWKVSLIHACQLCLHYHNCVGQFEINHQYCGSITSTPTLWYLSRLKQRTWFAFIPAISNVLKSKCRLQRADSE